MQFSTIGPIATFITLDTGDMIVTILTKHIPLFIFLAIVIVVPFATFGTFGIVFIPTILT